MLYSFWEVEPQAELVAERGFAELDHGGGVWCCGHGYDYRFLMWVGASYEQVSLCYYVNVRSYDLMGCCCL